MSGVRPGWYRVTVTEFGRGDSVVRVAGRSIEHARRVAVRQNALGRVGVVGEVVCHVEWDGEFGEFESDAPRARVALLERPLVDPFDSRLPEAPVTVESAGELGELLVLRSRSETIVLNEAEAVAFADVVRGWRRQ